MLQPQAGHSPVYKVYEAFGALQVCWQEKHPAAGSLSHSPTQSSAAAPPPHTHTTTHPPTPPSIGFGVPPPHYPPPPHPQGRWQSSHSHSLQPSPRAVQHTLVLRLCGDDVLLLVLVKPCHPLECQVVTFCCTRCEDDLLGISTYQGSYLQGGGVWLGGGLGVGDRNCLVSAPIRAATCSTVVCGVWCVMWGRGGGRQKPFGVSTNQGSYHHAWCGIECVWGGGGRAGR